MRGSLRFVVACGLISLATSAGAQEAPKFAKGPTGRDMVTYYPKEAMDLGLEGQAVIDCVIKPDYTLANCSVVSETPVGHGFGAAAIKLSILFRLTPSPKGLAGAHTQVPIDFRLAGSPLAEAEAAERARLSRLQWSRTPSADDLEKVRPQELTGEGSVTLRCHVRSAEKFVPQERGTLYDCAAVKETPAKIGLAKAAQSVVPLFQFDAATLFPMSARYTIDIDVSWAAKAGS